MKSINRILFIRVFAFSLIAVGCLFLYNCHLGPEGDPIIGVNGHVYDITTGEPKSGVWFDNDSLPPYLGKSDSFGYYDYQIFGYPPVKKVLYFGHTEYLALDTLITIRGGYLDTIDLYLKKK